MNKLSLLKSVFIFAGLDDGLLHQIEQQLKPVNVAAGGEIFLEKNAADSFYIVDVGEIVITRRLGPGQEKVLSVLGPGSVFGEMAFFSDSPRTANAIAKTDGRLWRIDRSGFMAFITREPSAGLRIVSGLLQVAMDRLEQTGRELATVYQAAKIISQSQRLADLITLIREELLLAIPEADNIATFLYNEYNMEFTPIAAKPGIQEVDVDDPLLARMKERLCGIVYNNADEPEFPKTAFLAGARSALLVPITKDEKLLGFMALWSARRTGIFRNSHSLLVSSVAGQLAEATENIRHRQQERDRRRLNNARQNYQHPK